MILVGQQPRCMSLRWLQQIPLPTDLVALGEVVVLIHDWSHAPSITFATSPWHSAHLPTSSKSTPFMVPLKLVIVTSWRQRVHQTLVSKR